MAAVDKPTNQYGVPEESKKLLLEGILKNPLHRDLPEEIHDAATSVHYDGSPQPVIPINWRFAESISAIKGFQASMLNVLLKRKYGADYQKIQINTDHAQLFFMSAVLPVLDPDGDNLSPAGLNPRTKAILDKYFPDCDKHDAHTDLHRIAVTNIYRTKDNRFFHLHGSLNPEVSQKALGIPHYHQLEENNMKVASRMYQAKVAEYNAADIDALMNNEHKQAGTICWSTSEFKESEHGKANAHVGLYELHRFPSATQKPTWWKEIPETGPARPLAGLKVVDLARIIAAPVVTRELAELGASVMRVTAPHITDYTILQIDMGWGKWESQLDLRQASDRDALRDLILEADVVLDGYRPGVMDKYGFGKNDILQLFEGKDRGIIYAHENCYGWNGPWSPRSGWQQISDACCGVSLEFGRAMGHNEAVTPVFPNSDYCTGSSGATGILQALIERAEKGGSYVVDIALNYYSQWLVNSCGTYPTAVWEKVWALNGNPVFHNSDNMGVTIPIFLKMIQQNAPGVIFNPGYFEDRESKALGIKIRTPKPVLKFPEGLVKPGYNVGTRGNGVDKPHWPQNLMEEIVA